MPPTIDPEERPSVVEIRTTFAARAYAEWVRASVAAD